ncbi:MAG: cyclic 2,3-diphosphoglycerate synthase [Planctomycetota bacterium]
MAANSQTQNDGTTPRNVIIMGAAGRDFHDFNVYWRNSPQFRVVAFTATQIPNIHGRNYPPELSGERYPEGIPIHAEEELEDLIKRHNVSLVTLAYSDLPHEVVMHQAARVNAAGAEFCLLGVQQTMIPSTKPVIAVCAVRTGCGKSQTSRRVTEILKSLGKKTAVVRHPMPYGDLAAQAVQRFASVEDMDRHHCTIEEREEYEPHIAAGNIVFAGVDYERILRAAEEEADIVLWDGGNNDTAFFKPDLYLTVVDPHRAGHEVRYYPGETNLRLADIIVNNKVDSAVAEQIALVENNARRVNPKAKIIRANSPVTIEQPELIRGKRVLVVEDGPTLTHGEMKYGAGFVVAKQHGAAEIIDPRPYAVGSIRGVFEKYNHLESILPAMGYGREQMSELAQTINAVPCDAVLIATPINLGALLDINKPATRSMYELEEHDRNILPEAIERMLKEKGAA